MTEEVKTEEGVGIMVEKVEAETVLDVDHNPEVIQGWYDMARGTTNVEGLQELYRAIQSVPKMTAGTTPHAQASLALAGLKMGLSGVHTFIDRNQWETLRELLNAAIDDVLETMN